MKIEVFHILYIQRQQKLLWVTDSNYDIHNQYKRETLTLLGLPLQ